MIATMAGVHTLLAVSFLVTLVTQVQSRLVTTQPDDYEETDEEFDVDYVIVLCPPDTYFNKQKDDCVSCSPCPMNTVLVKSCHRFQDTLCVPFPNLLDNSNHNDDNDDGNRQEQNVVTNTKAAAEWKSLSLVLFIIIALIVLALATIATVLFLLRRRRFSTTKEVVCEYGPAPKEIVCEYGLAPKEVSNKIYNPAPKEDPSLNT